MPPKRLVMIVEGKGDVDAAPVLVRKIISDMDGWDQLFLDRNVIKVGGPEKLTGPLAGNWTRYIKVAAKRENLGGILAVLDGDADHVSLGHDRVPFCAAQVASHLARESIEAGGGAVFSVACVFAMMEFESWLIAGVKSLQGKRLADGRPGVYNELREKKPDDTDVAPRGAKRWLSKNMPKGYSPSLDQKLLTELVALDAIRAGGSRSFKRLESAIRSIHEAVKIGKHIVSPECRG